MILKKKNSIRKLADDLNSKVRNNAVQVREKLADLIKNKPRSLVMQEAFDRKKEKEEKEESAKKENEERVDSAKASKIEAMLDNHLKKCLSFSKEISDIKDVEEMSEQEIRLVLLKWREVWDKKLEKLNESKDKSS